MVWYDLVYTATAAAMTRSVLPCQQAACPSCKRTAAHTSSLLLPSLAHNFSRATVAATLDQNPEALAWLLWLAAAVSSSFYDHSSLKPKRERCRLIGSLFMHSDPESSKSTPINQASLWRGRIIELGLGSGVIVAGRGGGRAALDTTR